MTSKHHIVGLVALLAAFTSTLNAVTLAPSSFGRVQDRPGLGTNGGQSSQDALSTSAGFLYVGDHSNNSDIYHTAYMFDLQSQDWSFVTPETTFVFRVQITGITEGGWPSLSLWHVPTFESESVSIRVIVGGNLVSTLNTTSASNGDWLEFDITSVVLSDITANRSYSIFRLSPESPLANNGNSLSDRIQLSADATLSSPSQIPEPSNAVLLGATAAATIAMLRRRRQA